MSGAPLRGPQAHRRRRPASPRGEEGHILVITLMVVVLVAAALALAAAAVEIRSRQARWEMSQVRLTALADAALAETLANLAADRGYAGVRESQLGDGSYSSQVTTVSGTSKVVIAEAELRGRRRTVRAEVHLTASSPPRVVRWERVPSQRAVD